METLWRKLRGTTPTPTTPFNSKRIENLPPKYWLASYKRETEAFHPHTKCILCDRVEKTLLLECHCTSIGTPVCNPCCQKYLLKRNKLFDLHRDKLLEQMNNKIGGPVIPLKTPPHKIKPLIPRKLAEAWTDPKNTTVGEVIDLALKHYQKDKPPTEGQTVNKESPADKTQTANPEDEIFNMIEVSTLSDTGIPIPSDRERFIEIHGDDLNTNIGEKDKSSTKKHKEDTNPNRDTTMPTPDEQAKSPHCTPKVAVTNPTKTTEKKILTPNTKTERVNILPPDETVNQQNETIAPIPHKDESRPQTPHLEGDYWITTSPDTT